MPNPKEKEVRERFEKEFPCPHHSAQCDGYTCQNKNIDFLLSELSRVEKETENRVWREAVGIANGKRLERRLGNVRVAVYYDQSHKRKNGFPPLKALGYNTACSDISSTLLSQVKQDE